MHQTLEITIGFMICRGWTDWTTTCYGYCYTPPTFWCRFCFVLSCQHTVDRFNGVFNEHVNLEEQAALGCVTSTWCKEEIHMSHWHRVWKPSLVLAQCIIETLHRNSKSKYIYCISYTTHHQTPSSIHDERVFRWMQWWIIWSDTHGDVEGSDLPQFVGSKSTFQRGQFQHPPDLAYGPRSALKSGLLEWEQTSRAREHRSNVHWDFGSMT